jgi:hypothetical protein
MPIGWNAVLNELIPLLAGLYPSGEKARFALRRAGLDPDEIDLVGAPKIVWFRIMEEANRHDAVREILRVAREDFPNVDFDALERQLEAPPPRGSRKLDEDWKAPAGEGRRLEQLIGAQPTFLPIRFLEIGLVRARAVAQIRGPLLGTGFLIRGDLLVTNHHVIATPEDARASKVWFNYQQTAAGTESPVEELALDPDAGFATSPDEGGDDWTAVRVQGAPGARWGFLELTDCTVKAGEYVNIIQHPSGLPKQIALYHNAVAYVDEQRVQYLTDTMPGSSGSPVFDSDWRVVALHHSGGWLPEPGTDKVFFRNEGTHVRALIQGLKKHGLL